MALTRIGSIGINTDITLGGISTFSADGVDITGVWRRPSHASDYAGTRARSYSCATRIQGIIIILS